MNTKKALALVSALLMVLALVACSDGSGDGSPNLGNNVTTLPSWFANTTWKGTITEEGSAPGEATQIELKTTSNEIYIPDLLGSYFGGTEMFSSLAKNGSFSTSLNGDTYRINFKASFSSSEGGIEISLYEEGYVSFTKINGVTVFMEVSGSATMTVDGATKVSDMTMTANLTRE